ncbi:MAG: aminotransferase class I/II-fold pyridoxal phosphate-dependent enzyme [Pseudoflavonifractor sp.]
MEYTHGGDIWSAADSYGGQLLDFSANLSPLGMPPAVRQAAERAVAAAEHYPDPLCRALVAAIGKHDGVPPEQILCGNGAADLIFRLVQALRPKKALLTAPTFSEYAQALRIVDCQIAAHLLSAERGFDLGEDFLAELTEDVDLCFLCNPNNPTGRAIPAALLTQILDRCAAGGICLVVDECFLALSDGAGPGLVGALERYPNLVLLRAFTKSYAIPGLRLGYCLTADLALLERLALCGQPWSVSAPAQAAGLAALELCPEAPGEARALIRRERAWLLEALGGLGLRVIPGSANYLLFQAVGLLDLKEKLIKRGILIRSCANYQGLSGDFYRVAVRPHGENQALLAALEEVL